MENYLRRYKSGVYQRDPWTPTTKKKCNIYKRPSLYSLILRSGKQEAKSFNKWACSEVLPDLRKHGVYVTKADSCERIQNPTGETKMHYKVKKHIETTYPT